MVVMPSPLLLLLIASCAALEPASGLPWSQEHAIAASLAGPPGGTRSVVSRDYSLITPDSRVYTGAPGWSKASVAHIVSPAFPTGAAFAMFIAEVPAGGTCAPAPAGHSRFVLSLRGEATWKTASGEYPGADVNTKKDVYAFFPAHAPYTCEAKTHTTLLVYEKRYDGDKAGDDMPQVLSGEVETSPLLDVGVEVFKLRKLLPQTLAYDFNVHVMDFYPGEYLKVREIHHNQHGLLLLTGEGIYRLGNDFHPVSAGDCIYMAPYVPQWYGALGTNTSRYILYKDANREPAIYAGAHTSGKAGGCGVGCSAAGGGGGSCSATATD